MDISDSWMAIFDGKTAVFDSSKAFTELNFFTAPVTALRRLDSCLRWQKQFYSIGPGRSDSSGRRRRGRDRECKKMKIKSFAKSNCRPRERGAAV